MGTSAILSPHISDNATLTINSQVSTLPGTNLQTPEAWQYWRASGNTVRIDLEFDAVRPISAFAMISLVHSPAAVWRALRAYDIGALYTSPDVVMDWTVISATGQPDARRYPNWRRLAKFTAVDAGAFAIEISDPSFGGVLQAWRLLVGDLFQPAGGIDHELGRPFESSDTQEARFGGGKATGARGNVAGKVFNWSAITRAEADELEDIRQACGNWRDVLFLLDPDDTTRLQRDSVLGPFAPGFPDINDVPLWPGDGSTDQMSRAAVRITESNA